jgi:hypothetical protein
MFFLLLVIVNISQKHHLRISLYGFREPCNRVFVGIAVGNASRKTPVLVSLPLGYGRFVLYHLENLLFLVSRFVKPVAGL